MCFLWPILFFFWRVVTYWSLYRQPRVNMYTPSRQLFFPVPLIDDADRLLFGSGKTVLRVTRQRTLFALDNAGCKLAHFFCLHSTLVLKAFFFFWRLLACDVKYIQRTWTTWTRTRKRTNELFHLKVVGALYSSNGDRYYLLPEIQMRYYNGMVSPTKEGPRRV